MKRIRIVFLTLMAAGFCGAEVIETRVFYDNFEGVPGVIWPDLGQDADPIAQTGAWLVTEQGPVGENPQGIQVCKNGSPGPVSGINYLAVNRTGAAIVRGNFTAPGGLVNTLVEFDMFVSSAVADQYNNGLNFWVRNSTAATGWDHDLFYDYFRANGTLNHGAVVLGTFLTDTWVHVTYTFSANAQHYDLTVGSGEYLGLNFSNSPEPQFQQLVFYAMAAPTLFYLDNISATTIECIPKPQADFTGDCVVDIADLAFLAQSWLDCNLEPAYLCAN